MRFGLDVAQQRMPWDEIVSRVQFAEELGFDGAWGFDHFQPMYGDGPGETFEGMTTLAALAGVTTRIRLGLLVTGVTYRHPSVFAAQAVTIDHASARPARAVARRGVVRQGARRARHPVPARPSSASTCSRTRSRSCSACSPATSCPTRARSCRCATPSCGRRPCSSPTRRSGSAAAAQSARCRSSPGTPTCGTPGARRTRSGTPTSASTSSPVEAGRDPATIMRASSLSLDDLDTARKHAAKWRDAGFGYLVCGWPEAGRSQVEAFAREVMPEFTDPS